MSRLLGGACNSVTLSNTLSLREEGVFNFCWLLAKGTAINLAQKWDKRNGRPAARRWWTWAIFSSILSPPLRSRAWWEYNIKHSGFWLSEQVQKRRKCFSCNSAARGGFQSQISALQRQEHLKGLISNHFHLILFTQDSDIIPHFPFWCKWNVQLEIHSSVLSLEMSCKC